MTLEVFLAYISFMLTIFHISTRYSSPEAFRELSSFQDKTMIGLLIGLVIWMWKIGTVYFIGWILFRITSLII